MLKNIIASVPNVLLSFTFVLPVLFCADSASATPLSTRALNQEQTAALNLHNQARAEVYAGNELQWDSTLQQHAKEWADELAKRGKDINLASHSQGTGEGENLWQSSGGDLKLSAAVQSWLKEKSNYDGEAIPNLDKNNPNYDRNLAFFLKIGHYTQCVWKKTTKVGIAKARAQNGKLYVVARYSPPGNFQGQKAY